MVGRKLSPTIWVALGAVATVILAVVGVSQLFYPNSPIGLPAPTTTDPPGLTATIKSFPYRHAESDYSSRGEEWNEEWLQPLEHRLKKRDIAPELLETVVEAMKDVINEKWKWEAKTTGYNIADSQKWYSVTIKNDGDIPLKGIFLKFPSANFWINERGRLTFVPVRIEIGHMDQKSEKRFTFWGSRLGSRSRNEEVVLGHSNGIGTIDFE